MEKQPPEAFFKKVVLRDFAKFKGKYLCWKHFLKKLQVFMPETL